MASYRDHSSDMISSLDSRMQHLEYDRTSHGRQVQRLADDHVVAQRHMQAVDNRELAFEKHVRELEMSFGRRLEELEQSYEKRFSVLEAEYEVRLRQLDYSYEVRFQEHESDQETILEYHLQQLDIAREGIETPHRQERKSVSPVRPAEDLSETEAIVRKRPRQEPEIEKTPILDLPMPKFQFRGLKPVELHACLPRVLFLIDPENNSISDGSDFTAGLTSRFKKIFSIIIDEDDEYVQSRLVRLNESPNRTSISSLRRCLFGWLNNLMGSVWTKEYPRLYACRSCVNMQRLCMIVVQGRIVILPLHPLLRVRAIGDQGSGDKGHLGNTYRVDATSVPSIDLGYWFAGRPRLTTHPPYDAQIWANNAEREKNERVKKHTMNMKARGKAGALELSMVNMPTDEDDDDV